MNKSFILFALVAITCVNAIHMQTYGPSRPGGSYYGANGTSSGGRPANGTQPYYPNYPSYPSQPTYPNYPSYPSQPTYPGQPTRPAQNSTSGVLVNGQPYNFTGPFRLVCYVINSNTVFR